MKKSFIDNIDNQTLAGMIDETLNYEKRQRSERGKGNMMNMLKIASAAAMIVLVIGIANLTGVFNIDEILFEPNAEVTVVDEPAALSDTGELTEISRAIEKSVFENFLKSIPAGKDKRKIEAYYSLKFLDNGAFYIFDQCASDRETAEILEIWNEYINWNDRDYLKMLLDYQMLDSEYLKPLPPREIPDYYGNNRTVYPGQSTDIDAIEEDFLLRDPELYSHVRFGENKNILLLDIEWHTPETYAEFIEEQRAHMLSVKQTEEYMQQTEEWKNVSEKNWEDNFKRLEQDLNEIADGTRIISNTINGRNFWAAGNIGFYSGEGRNAKEDYAKHHNIDENGYCKSNVYPHYFWVNEQDFVAYSKQEFDDLLEKEAIPLLNDQLENGLISQEYYDNTYDYITKDPLDATVERYFGKAGE